MFLLVLLSFLAVAIYTVLYISRRKFDYWKIQKVPHLKPTSIVGNYGNFLTLKRYVGYVQKDILEKFPNEPYVGAYYGTEPVLIVQDPEIVKLITTKDFYYFSGREATGYSHKEIITQNLFFQGGDEWKVARQNLTPLFSSAKMRNMFHLIEKCAIEFEKTLDSEVALSDNTDVRKLFGRFTMACICSCAFGVDIDSLGKDYNKNPFIIIGNTIFDSSTIRGFFNIFRGLWPSLFYVLRLRNFPEKLNMFFRTFLTDVFEGRQYTPTTRNDFIDLLLTLKQKKYVTGDSISNSKTGDGKKIQLPVTDDFMISQCVGFFAAGFETSATTSSNTLYELAKNSDALKKVQAEIDEFLRRHDNKLVYDCVTELPFTEMCIDEALRLHPVLGSITREVMDEYTLPGTDVVLEKGVRVHLPVYHMHRNPDYFPEPEKYCPERFSPEGRKNIIPHTYIPFGEGARICIASTMFLLVLLSILAATIYTLLYITRRKFDYWKIRKVPHLKPSTIVGNFGDFITLKKYIGCVHKDILEKFPSEPYVGAYYGTEPVLIVQDPDIVKLITTKDFYYFHGREATGYSHKEIVTQNLFFQGGDEWKVTRQNLTPLFSSAKMRNMFHLIEKCAIEFEKTLDDEVAMSDKNDVRMLVGRFTMAGICSCAFGVDINSMGKDYNKNPFIMIGNTIFDSSTIRGFFNIVRGLWPSVFYALGLRNFPEKLNKFFKTFLTDVFEGRQYTPTTRNDFIDLLLNLKQKKYVTGDSISNSKTGTGDGKKIQLPVTDDFMIAQCMVFFAAGFETSATTSSNTLYELAKNPDALKKAQAEIDEFLRRHDNKLVYDCVTELPFTETCVDEALRLHPVLGVIAREVMYEYTIPGTDVVLEKGVRVHLPVYHLHHNQDYFPEPEKFRPERFSPEGRKNIIPHTYIPFGDGARICIGMRFAKMQMMAGLITVLKKYNVEVAEGMPSKLEFDPRSIVTQPYSGIHLKFTPREGWQTRLFAKQ